MAIAHGSGHEKVIRAAIGALGGMGRFISNGDIVVIKPNVAFDRPPALAATTHPDALRAVARLVLEAGAAKVLVADNPINSPSGCHLKSGLLAVADELHLDLYYPVTNSFAPIQMDGETLRHWAFFDAPFKRATKVIGPAPCKDHNLCRASMTMKNWYGLCDRDHHACHLQGPALEFASHHSDRPARAGVLQLDLRGEGISRPLHQVRPVHPGLPDQRPPARDLRGRHRGDLDPDHPAPAICGPRPLHRLRDL